MKFTLKYSDIAEMQLREMAANPALLKRFKAVKKALGYLEINPKHPSLNTHEYNELTRMLGKKIFEAYAENKTPAACRIFWYYGDEKNEITIISITQHP